VNGAGLLGAIRRQYRPTLRTDAAPFPKPPTKPPTSPTYIHIKLRREFRDWRGTCATHVGDLLD
jgi:hypothetical protein